MTRQGIPLRFDRNALVENDRQSWCRAITARALATAQHDDPQKIIRAAWPNDAQAAVILRSAVSPTMTTDYPSHDAVTVFKSLAPSSAAWQLFERAKQNKLDMRGVSTIRIPRVSNLPVAPIFVGEGRPGPVLMFTMAATTIGPVKKILCLSAITAELESATPGTASAVIGRVLSDATTKSVDTIAFDTNAADSARPAGLLHSVTPTTAASAGLDAVYEDRAALVGAIGASGVDPTGTVFICSPREAQLMADKVGEKLGAGSIFASLGLPSKTVTAFAPAAVFSGYQGVPEIETARETALHFEDTAPAEIVSSPGIVAAPSRSMFQSDLIAIRVRAQCAWAVAPGGAQYITGVNW
jgi:hypothetical protein